MLFSILSRIGFLVPIFFSNYFANYSLLTHSLTPWSTVLLQKLTGIQPVKKFPVFYGTRRFITAFRSASHCPYLEPNLSSLFTHFLKIQLNIFFPSTPGSPKCPLSLMFPHQNPVYASPLTDTRYMPHPPILFFPILLLEQCWVRSTEY